MLSRKDWGYYNQTAPLHQTVQADRLESISEEDLSILLREPFTFAYASGVAFVYSDLGDVELVKPLGFNFFET